MRKFIGSKPWTSNINPNVFFSTVSIIIIFLLIVIVAPNSFEFLTQQLRDKITTSFSWFYVIAVAFFLGLLIFIACSSSGNIRLGPDHSRPQYKNSSWFAMLFTAGMGIGLMFFGVAEPVMHYIDPPTGEPQSTAAAQQALRISFFHWGIHAWAIYALVGLSFGYFAYRHNLPLSIRSAFYPIMGKKIYGKWGDSIDTFATIGMVFGLATSLGYGVNQINGGFNYLFGIEKSNTVQIILILVACVLTSISVFLGLDKGIKRLSEINLILAILLLLFVFITGPTLYMLQITIENTGHYISNLFYMTFNLDAYKNSNWVGGWTVFYWSWYISCAPYVGLFIARISRGRTIREFIIGVSLIPVGFTLIWMGFFGGSALFSIINNKNINLLQAVNNDSTIALFEFLNTLPLSTISSLIATILILLFFVTSADSGALVIDSLTSKTDQSFAWQRLFWVMLMAILAIILLLVGGLAALQSSLIISALPFTVVMLLMSWGLIKALRIDVTRMKCIQEAHITPRAILNPRSWQQRLNLVIHSLHEKNEVNYYISTQVLSAFENIQIELRQRQLEVEIKSLEQGLQLNIAHHNETNFIYTVLAQQITPPNFLYPSALSIYFQAEVFLGEDGQNYYVMNWTLDDLIQDIIYQYERHLHFLDVIRTQPQLRIE